MKLSKLLIGALVIGLAAQTTGCKKDKLSEKEKAEKEKRIGSCPGCGMG